MKNGEICNMLTRNDKNLKLFDPGLDPGLSAYSSTSSFSSTLSLSSTEQGGSQIKKQILEKVKSLENDYLNVCLARRDSAYYALNEFKPKIDDSLKSIRGHPFQRREWWLILFEEIDDEYPQLLDAVHRQVENNGIAYENVKDSFHNRPFQHIGALGIFVKKVVKFCISYGHNYHYHYY